MSLGARNIPLPGASQLPANYLMDEAVGPGIWGGSACRLGEFPPVRLVKSPSVDGEVKRHLGVGKPVEVHRSTGRAGR
jgi:hypothetical protein